MDGNQTQASDSQFISFQDFPSINHGGNNDQAQLHVHTSSHQGFSNLSNDSTGIGIIEDLQGMPDKSEGSYLFNDISNVNQLSRANVITLTLSQIIDCLYIGLQFCFCFLL